MNNDEEHVCDGTDGEWVVCIDGRVYDDCGHPNCNGACDDVGDCLCECHR